MTQAFCPMCGFDLHKAEPITIGPATYEPGRGFSYDGQPVTFEPCQRILIETLMRADGRSVKPDALIERMDIVGNDPSNTLRQQIYRSRRRLKPYGAERHIQNVWAEGYRWAL